MQSIYGEREHRAARRALRAEAGRAIVGDLILAALLIGSLFVAGVCG